MKLIFRLFLIACIALMITLSVFSVLKCAMCGKIVELKLQAEIITENNKKNDFCCVHCAIMFLSNTKEKVKEIFLTDYLNGKMSKAEAMTLVINEQKALCCAPLIVAFTNLSDAEKYQKEQGGEIYTWEAAASKLSQVKCMFCQMAIYPPEAIKLIGTKELSACCPLCALAQTYSDKFNNIKAICNNDFKDIIINLPITENTKTIFWQGLKEKDGQVIPAGCHFNKIFCDENCFNTWHEKNQTMMGKKLNSMEAMSVAKKMHEKKVTK